MLWGSDGGALGVLCLKYSYILAIWPITSPQNRLLHQNSSFLAQSTPGRIKDKPKKLMYPDAQTNSRLCQGSLSTTPFKARAKPEWE